MPFTGFTEDTMAFLGELSEHNDRAWFAENRERFERELLEPQKEFVDAVGSAFSAIDQRVQAVPVVGRSIFRINRDTRFSPDKAPYKRYADVWFWIGSDRKFSAGYFVRMVPGEVWIGGGVHRMTTETLRLYRAGVVDGVKGQMLAHVVADVEAVGFEVHEPALQRVPAGFSAQHPRAELLRHKDLFALVKASPPPAEFYCPQFVSWSMERFAQVKPLVDWLAEQLGGVYPPDQRL
jgi:uncharacterized protein (TIGR02453 family)